MKEYVLGFMFSSEKERVVLIKKTKPEWQAGFLNGIGGKIEEGESPIDAMVREFHEEADVITYNWTPFAVMTNSQFTVHCFKTTTVIIDEVKSKTEEEVVVVFVDEIGIGLHTVIPNLHWLIPMALDDGFEPVTIKYLEADKYTEPVK
jgi:8-oxo-dGTP diphosphatase